MTEQQNQLLQSDQSDDSKRLESLDILRGFDLFLLVGFQPVLMAFGQVAQWEWLTPLLHQFDHEMWEGFRFWVLIMPLFLFMAGMSMPFSLSKYKQPSRRSALYRRIVKRVIVLFILGMVVQGNLLTLDASQLKIYTNTLQAIAAGYLIAFLVLTYIPSRRQIAATVLLLLIYMIPFLLTGDYSMEGNFAARIDKAVLGRFQGDPSYTWIWSSLTFGVTVLLGAFCGQMIRTGHSTPLSTVHRIISVGVGLVLLSLLVDSFHPIIKRIWSGSMTLLAGGYCFLLAGLFYYWIDVKGHGNGLRWLKVYGMNSIAAYLLGEVVNFRCIAHSVSYGLQNHFGDFYSVWLTAMNFLILYVILCAMSRLNIYLKI